MEKRASIHWFTNGRYSKFLLPNTKNKNAQTRKLLLEVLNTRRVSIHFINTLCTEFSPIRYIDIDHRYPLLIVDISTLLKNIDIDMVIFENIDIDRANMKNIDIDKAILKKISILIGSLWEILILIRGS